MRLTEQEYEKEITRLRRALNTIASHSYVAKHEIGHIADAALQGRNR